MSLDLAATLAVVTPLVRRAGALLLEHQAAPLTALTKSSRIDIVTAADRASEALLIGALREHFPSHHFVGEEGGGQGAPAETAPFHWYIDPLDGTVNFASRLPHFCVSVALTTPEREPLLAVIFDPTRDELFTARAGQGAWLNGQPLRVTPTAALLDAVISSGFPYDRATNPDNNLREWATFLPHIRGERRFGSAALDLAYVAAGRLDGYWELDLKLYDVMAGLLLVREAGGRVSDDLGAPEPQQSTRGRYVASNGLLHEPMLALLRQAAARPFLAPGPSAR